MRKFRSTPSTGKRIALLGAVAAYFGLLYLVGWHYKMYDYMKTYNVFNNLNRVEINELPLTQNERIQPLRNIFSMANEFGPIKITPASSSFLAKFVFSDKNP